MKKELEIFSTRYSCRNFKNEKLKKEDLNSILEIARLSPSSLGLEPWKFIVVQDEKRKEELSKICNQQKRLDAYMPFLKSLNQEEKISYAREQAHIALASILYSANALNIASCTIGGFDKQKLNSYLSLDIQKERSSLVVALGYCNDEKNPQKNRFSFDEVVKFI
ncbi:NAD(P)H-dependent oxidoreductase [Campylobacter jejuni]|uniref:NAD(P)H-dependent oxidoreductase n=1 Tax=Campylobacter jejuni TaxID=197 RepID=UPI000D15E558|nr:NAD(P)H-dependent oxidoreductase [Campylobacter jejuni]AVS37570.1 NAD(P)H-dependent oxidoreductase [Campylobacter jejuni]EAK2030608.1 NAD(P)H-dependent oxidoreductase [Campylobacter jejuni]ECL2426844.1 NAD(P)H-dependent oxidoreductase [Campylobacter jejuni]ECO2185864.1 NAD(P)H-dependent oxidoreductase [Campylobacter jejuni]ECO5778808.1 NAD(P)H-dependent oxidoreductase [Campylobacter jejuni]